MTGFLGLDPELPVESPEKWHPSKQVLGFTCKRREVSGERLWALIAQIWQVGYILGFATQKYKYAHVHNKR